MNDIFKNNMGIPAPLAPKGRYPVTDMEYIAGGLHAVSNENLLVKIPVWLRRIGMEVYVLSSGKKFRLIHDDENEFTNILTDWKEVKEGGGTEGGITEEEVNNKLANLKEEIGNEFVTLETLERVYITKDEISRLYQSKDDMSLYATVEMINNLALSLSKIVTRVIPPDTIKVNVGTPVGELILPDKVTITFADGMSTQVPVHWDTSAYVKNQAGFQMLEGTMYLPDFIINNAENFTKCNLFIQVIGDSEEPIPTPTLQDVSGFNIEEIIVNSGTLPSELVLPETVSTELVNTDGSVEFKDLPVSWNLEPLGEEPITLPRVITGELVLTKTMLITNILDYKPEIPVVLSSTGATDGYQYKIFLVLPAGETELDLSSTSLKGLACEDIYGTNQDPKQATVDIRFLGLIDNDGNTVYSVTTTNADGIYMPVLTSPVEDIASFKSTVNDLSQEAGFYLESEIPGASTDPRVRLDDNTKRLIFGSAVSCSSMFLIRKCKSGTIYSG